MADTVESIAEDAVQLLRELRSVLFVGPCSGAKTLLIQRINEIEDRHLEERGITVDGEVVMNG